MNFLRLLPVFLSALLLAAHFFRSGLMPVVVLALVFPALLIFKRAWAARLVQAILALGAIEWLRTLVLLVAQRQAVGQNWTRLAIILGVVALFTGGSAFVFSFTSLRKRYRLGGSFDEGVEYLRHAKNSTVL
jgi:hypothetical protein